MSTVLSNVVLSYIFNVYFYTSSGSVFVWSTTRYILQCLLFSVAMNNLRVSIIINTAHQTKCWTSCVDTSHRLRQLDTTNSGYTQLIIFMASIHICNYDGLAAKLKKYTAFL